MIGCLRTLVRNQPIIALYFESENEFKFHSLEVRMFHQEKLEIVQRFITGDYRTRQDICVTSMSQSFAVIIGKLSLFK